MELPESSPAPRGIHRLFNLLARLPVSDRLLVHVLLATVLASGLWFILSLNATYTETVPVTGGTIVEGVLGTPRFINPVLATSRADRDLVTLVYDGVLTLDQNGTLVPHLATTVEQSDDGRIYTINLRDDITFHDGTPLTATDVVFTYQLVQDAELKSPKRGNWNNVEIRETDEYQVEIRLPEPYAPFRENLTTGIMPQHIWKDIPTSDIPFHKRNVEPIGSGPYAIETVHRTDDSSISGYTLTAHPGGAHTGHLDSVSIRFFRQEPALRAALRAEEITSTADLNSARVHEFTTDDYHVNTATLPRVFGIFFNQNRNPALRNQAARQALSVSVDRARIVERATHGLGVPTTYPVPPGFTAIESINVSSHPELTANASSAVAILEADGWELNSNDVWERDVNDETITLSVTLRAPAGDMYTTIAEEVVAGWEDIGVEVQREHYEEPDLLEGIIRPREFEAVLFGVDVGHSVDLYPFWHSSQQTDPGLNISQFTSIATDERLTTLRGVTDEATERETKQAIVETIAEEVPAMFLFSPTVTHVIHHSVTVQSVPYLTEPSDRLRSLTTWHRETQALWPIFHTHPTVLSDL